MSRLPPGRGGGYPPAGKYSAARSHVMNDKYMEEFERAWEELHAMNLGEGGGGPPGGGTAAAARAGNSLAAHQRNVYASLEDPSGPPPSYGMPSSAVRRTTASPARGSRPAAPPSRAAGPPPPARPGGPGLAPPGAAPRRASAAAYEAGGGGAAGAAGSRYPGRAAAGWQSGPPDPAGVMCDLSDRPNACSAADWSRGEVVIGSTDHALYVLDANRGLRKRTLYSKTSGHAEWVTCVTYAGGGRIVSGGMDSKLWVWPASGNKGMVAEAHFGPISQVKYDKCSDLVVSASYDKTIRLWELGARPHEAGCLQGHDAPVLEMQISPDGRIVSGDRSGHVLLWDISAGGVSWRMKNVHQGHVTALAWFDENAGSSPGEGEGCFVTGGQDGVVRVWDPRAKSNVAKVQLHVNEQGHGAVGDIIAGGPAVGGLVVTAGADGTARVLDPRLGFALSGTVRLTNFPYSMTAAGGTAAVGCGDGSIHFFDIATGRTLYALGANRAAVRCMEASYDKLVCSGDDGKAIVYSFAG
ncbi:hypothetical protein PLESTB_001137600 [Pleodorina starrii]|uniref:Uncharacterized protein n=1 Tax=Pleodorina starrii TaxID=330485 RepID=A0A9W6F520_9CHLO|nr:hypothetical protein PLESTM_000567200 [Pleodorina starrii]GLC56712.1 hypothetical protein PLESTB_001137600 [Pleodorina starrii]GLC66870.1 hypothetical protein PLESTF_000485100 [Pleodorina starrii]